MWARALHVVGPTLTCLSEFESNFAANIFAISIMIIRLPSFSPSNPSLIAFQGFLRLPRGYGEFLLRLNKILKVILR